MADRSDQVSIQMLHELLAAFNAHDIDAVMASLSMTACSRCRAAPIPGDAG